MHEKAKLAAARHFLDRMHAEHGDPTAFALELGAFLGESRSALQHAWKEATQKPGGQFWYEQRMADPLLCFFRDLRNSSIHEVPVKPLTKRKSVVAPFLSIGDDDDEFLIPYPHDTTVHWYEFEERPGDEVTELAQQYLKALDAVVADGVAMGWISG